MSASEGEAAPRAGWLGGVRRFVWLAAILAISCGAAELVTLLNRAVDDRIALADSRNEAASLRRVLFVAQDKLRIAERDRRTESATAAQLESALAHGAVTQASPELMTKLRAQLDPRDGDVTSEGTRISVSIVDQTLFAAGEAELSARGKTVLAHLGTVLKEVRDQQMMVGGYTDDTPLRSARFASNWELSSARAVSVTRFLVETVGVDPHDLSAAGYGEFHPRTSVRSDNRRVEILLSPLVELKR